LQKEKSKNGLFSVTDGLNVEHHMGAENSTPRRPSGHTNLNNQAQCALFVLRRRMFMKKVAIIMGSDSDLPVVQKAADTLQTLGIPFEVHVYSAHRTPDQARDFARNARENGFGAIIAAAGMAAHLAGAIAANTTLPVVGIPCKSSNLDGIDALLSTVQMPSGIPVATVAVNGGVNAALLCAQILAVEDRALAAMLDAKRSADAEIVLAKDAKISARFQS
jgi:5-(carboxyamino)imidazole ribonucleotide mutase